MTIRAFPTALLCLLAFLQPSFAVKGTAIMTLMEQDLYFVDIETGDYRLAVAISSVPEVSGGFHFPYFSPDGRSISFWNDNAFWVMNNDGSGVKRVVDWAGSPSKGKNYIYTGTHFMWAEADGRYFRADTTTGTRVELIQIPDNNGIWGSRDGRRVVSWSHPDSLAASLQFAPVIDFSADFSTAIYYRSKLWGHGWFVSGDGRHAVINAWTNGHYNIPSSQYYGGHKTFVVVDLDVDTLVKTFPVASTPADQQTLTYQMHYVPNKDEWFVSATCTGDCSSRDGHWYVYNYRTEESYEINTSQISQVLGSNPYVVTATSVFIGEDLPDLSATSPVISLGATRLDFIGTYASQTVAVSNSGAGTLADVVTTVEQDGLSWLTVSRSGSGNAQTLTNAVDTSGLTGGVYYATVRASAAAAINTPSYTVTLIVGDQLLPPSDLQATSSSTPPSVTLTWTDNTDAEMGFLIERRQAGGSFAQIAVAATDDTTFTDDDVLEATYEYRVRAFAAADTSAFTQVASATVTILPYATVTTPAAGAQYRAGDTVYIQWTAHNLPLIEIKYSVDNGENWVAITHAGGVEDSDSLYGNYPWVVPAVNSSQMIVRVNSYQENEFGGTSGLFSVNATGVRFADVPQCTRVRQDAAAVYDCRGRLIAVGTMPQLRHVNPSAGVYVMRPVGANQARSKAQVRMVP